MLVTMPAGQSLQGINAGRITFVTVPTTGYTDAEGNEEPRTEDISALFAEVLPDRVIVLEEDIEVAPDFFRYFERISPMLDDPDAPVFGVNVSEVGTCQTFYLDVRYWGGGAA